MVGLSAETTLLLVEAMAYLQVNDPESASKQRLKTGSAKSHDGVMGTVSR
jgi:hypothetical protein